jgi:hypothetical protein
MKPRVGAGSSKVEPMIVPASLMPWAIEVTGAGGSSEKVPPA